MDIICRENGFVFYFKTETVIRTRTRLVSSFNPQHLYSVSVLLYRKNLLRRDAKSFRNGTIRTEARRPYLTNLKRITAVGLSSSVRVRETDQQRDDT